MLKNLKIRNKILLLLAIPILSLLFTIIITVNNMHAVTQDNSEIYDGTKYGLKADKDLYQALLELNKLCFFNLDDEEFEDILKSYENNISKIRERVEIVKKISDKYKDDIIQYVNEDSKQTIYYELDQFEIEINKWEDNSKLLLETIRKDKKEFNDILINFKNRENEFNDARKHLKYARNVFEDFSADLIEKQHKTKNSLVINIILLSTSTLVIVFILGWLFIRDITRSMKEIVEVMEKIAQKDLRVEKIKRNSQDEMGQLSNAGNRMVDNLKNLITEICKSVEQFTSSSKQLSVEVEHNMNFIKGVTNAAEELAKGAAEQVENVEEGSRKLDALAEKINVVVKNSDKMKHYADTTYKSSEDGMSSIIELNDIVKVNTDISQKVAFQMNVLDEKSSSVSQITYAIQAISGQTNLLAINASIEAVNAGKAGKGFAVVAKEIRNLSQQTSNCVDAIEKIVSEIQNEVSNTKVEIDELALSIEKTNQVSDNTAKAFKTIDDAVKDTILQIDELIQNIENIYRNKDEVVYAIQGISTITEEAVVSTEEVASSVDAQNSAMGEINRVAFELQQVAITLEELINNFSL